MLCILYVIAIGVALGVAGRLVETSLPAAAPRRAIWCATIALSVVIPPVFRARHTASLGELAQAVDAPWGGWLLPILTTDWWANTGAWDAAINRGWLVASAGLVVWGAATAVWAWRAVRLPRAAREGDAQVDGVQVRVTESVGPATVGLVRPRVVLPAWVLALPSSQRRYVVRHEEEHRRAHDALLLFVAALPLVLTPWNVALWWQLRRLRLAVEMDCDARVVAALGGAREYGTLLLRVAEAASRGPRLQPALLGSAGSLEARLRALVAPPAPGAALRLAAAAFALVLVLGVLAFPHPVLGRHRAHAAATASATVTAAR